MSVKLMELIWERAPYHEHGILLVLLALANWANDEGFCWPKMETLAAKSRQSRRNISYILKRLEGDEIIDLQRGNGRGHGSHYRINVERLQRMQPLQSLKVAKDEVVASFATFPTQKRVQRMKQLHPLEEEEKGAKGAKGANSDISHNKDARAEPSVKETKDKETKDKETSLSSVPKTEPTAKRSRKKPDEYTAYPKFCELFTIAVIRPTGSKGSKQEALEWWRKHHIEENPRLADHVIQTYGYQKTTTKWRENGGEFVPELQRWIRHKRWEGVEMPSSSERIYQPGDVLPDGSTKGVM